MVYESTLVKCPLDDSHILKKERLQYHLVRCLKQYNGTKVRCPYNATEYIEVDDLPEHILKCEYRRPIEVHTYCSTKSGTHMYTAPFNHQGPETDECWGLD
ncbi:gametocyte-specific factor 1-like [Cimex lectularius]|uniref:CHHC U11-48K-type domain-containing protein n=1 Tax=Cimex lectularius TaxID=79782 RepID=A0A8I6RA23_CIMLE|nr:gametocyte-specific factor 1-like [Cimex lectularius]